MAVKHTSKMHKGHRSRMRKRFSELDASKFDDDKLLEIILYGSVSRADTYPIAHNLLDAFGSLDAVFSASVDELAEVKGVGNRSAVNLACIGTVINKIFEEVYSAKPFDSYETLHSYLTWTFRNEKVDFAVVMFFDGSNKLIKSEKLQNSSSLDTVIVNNINNLKNKIQSVIVAHKHPDDCNRPSCADIETTQKLYKLCCDLNIESFEHYIMSGSTLIPIVSGITGDKQELLTEVMFADV